MKRVASSDQELTVEERNLLSVAYKNVIGARRASWRIVSSIEQKEESKGNEAQVSMIKGYREKIESELAKICEDILEVLEKHLIHSLCCISRVEGILLQDVSPPSCVTVLANLLVSRMSDYLAIQQSTPCTPSTALS